MSRFTIEIPQNKNIAREMVKDRSVRFPWDWMQHDPQRFITQDLGVFFRALQDGGYWEALSYIDGSNNWFQPDLPERRQERRLWAKGYFNDSELNAILDICVDTALTIPIETNSPGTYRGHIILFRELVEKPDSMFREAVTDDVRKRLNNGRFWEAIPDMMLALNMGIGYRVVEDVLINYFEDLDPKFAREGYSIFRRNRGEKQLFDLKGLSKEAIEKYRYFIDHINKGPIPTLSRIDELFYLRRPIGQVVS